MSAWRRWDGGERIPPVGARRGGSSTFGSEVEETCRSNLGGVIDPRRARF
jgi:hypothetical protein